MLLFAFITAAMALTVPGAVLAVRALPPVQRLVDAGVKPWACDVCSCFWITGLLGVGAAAVLRDPWMLVCCGPAYTVAMILLSHMERPAPLPPPPPMEPGLAEHLEGP